MASPSLGEGILLGMGNPLLDIQVRVAKEYLDSHGLERDAQILATDKHLPIFDEISKMKDIQYIPGGAAQNALRVFQWIVKQPRRATFFGSVGDDEYATILRREATNAGVDVHYQVQEGSKTGTCAALINDHYRSLVAHLAAAEEFTAEHIQSTDSKARIEKAGYYYISGFFLTPQGTMEAIESVAKHAAEKNKCFAMNIGADFVPTYFLPRFLQVLPYVDYLFGNEKEYKAYAKASNLDAEDLRAVAVKIAEHEKENKQRKRVVVITRDAEPIIIACAGEQVQEFPVPKVPDIVDSNGAGDAFVGGFLAELLKGKGLDKCVKCGCFAAGIVLRHQGCTFPERCDYQGS